MVCGHLVMFSLSDELLIFLEYKLRLDNNLIRNFHLQVVKIYLHCMMIYIFIPTSVSLFKSKLFI